MTAGTRTVVVLGATGRIGRAAVQAFAAAGWRVVAQSRREAGTALPAGARALAADPLDSSALAASIGAADVVLHALNLPYGEWSQGALPLARAALDLAERLGAHVLLPGNVYNFGPGMPPLLRVDTPQLPGGEKGRLRVAIEDAMRERSARGLRCTVLRAGDFFGAGEGSWLDLAVTRSLPRGRLCYPGPTDRVHAWAYLPDLARAFVALAAAAPGPPFECLHFAGHAVTGAQLLAATEEAAGRLGLQPRAGWRREAFPWWLLRLGAPFKADWRGVIEMRYLWEVPHALDGTALERRIGPLPATPLVDALEHTLARQYPRAGRAPA